mmetsp:Transcript_17390/g.26912  ORF Transcript_17390/g.26912 Transcript_17390/m.26912 type:complete len:149 (+) Transcript_17390:420-866(+)
MKGSKQELACDVAFLASYSPEDASTPSYQRFIEMFGVITDEPFRELLDLVATDICLRIAFLMNDEDSTLHQNIKTVVSQQIVWDSLGRAEDLSYFQELCQTCLSLDIQLSGRMGALYRSMLIENAREKLENQGMALADSLAEACRMYA